MVVVGEEQRPRDKKEFFGSWRVIDPTQRGGSTDRTIEVTEPVTTGTGESIVDVSATMRGLNQYTIGKP